MDQANMKTLSLVCPSCGGRMELSEDGEKAVCPYCGHKLLIEKEDRIGDLEKEFEQADEEYKIASSERDSRKPDILYRRGKCYYENSLYKEAYLIFQYIPGYRDVDQILREDCIRRGYQEALCTPGATIRFGSYVQRDGGE